MGEGAQRPKDRRSADRQAKRGVNPPYALFLIPSYLEL
jgi:hypothetical protein